MIPYACGERNIELQGLKHPTKLPLRLHVFAYVEILYLPSILGAGEGKPTYWERILIGLNLVTLVRSSPSTRITYYSTTNTDHLGPISQCISALDRMIQMI